MAKQYAEDATSKTDGGVISDVTANEYETAANKALFSAPLNKIVGPVKGIFGYYVIDVSKSTKSVQKTLAQESATVKSLLTNDAKTAAETKVTAYSKKNFGKQTLCSVTYSATDCANYKAPKTTSTAAPATAGTSGRRQRRLAPRRPHQSPAPRRRRAPRRRAPLPPHPLGSAVSSGEPEITAALGRLDEITRRLRLECPWDREQTERTIVPHTVEEAYELADAANTGDDAKLLDELGDVLFQVHILALMLEERGAGNPRRRRQPRDREADPPPPARLR